MSSETRSHDVVGASGEGKMESSQGKAEGYLQGDARAVSRKRGQNWEDLDTRNLSARLRSST
ncbi:MAG: hypothetical protein JW755_11410, partial [Candidatus Aminicenantes bacterium]|nr:hypothetical protein [Candidatus Aminicenantes bacterium]